MPTAQQNGLRRISKMIRKMTVEDAARVASQT